MRPAALVAIVAAVACMAAVAHGGNFYQDTEMTWGQGRGKVVDGGRGLDLTLDRTSGSGFQSKSEYLFGKIDMQIKLVPGNSACKEVALELYTQVREAELSGIPLWRLVLDPGIGFSKKSGHNLEVIMGLESIRREMGKMSIGASHVPILLGPSRKRFLGEICNRANPVERDVATVAAVTAGILNGANIVRVHNAGYGADAAKVCDALRKGRSCKN